MECPEYIELKIRSVLLKKIYLKINFPMKDDSDFEFIFDELEALDQKLKSSNTLTKVIRISDLDPNIYHNISTEFKNLILEEKHRSEMAASYFKSLGLTITSDSSDNDSSDNIERVEDEIHDDEEDDEIYKSVKKFSEIFDPFNNGDTINPLSKIYIWYKYPLINISEDMGILVANSYQEGFEKLKNIQNEDDPARDIIDGNTGEVLKANIVLHNLLDLFHRNHKDHKEKRIFSWIMYIPNNISNRKFLELEKEPKATGIVIAKNEDDAKFLVRSRMKLHNKFNNPNVVLEVTELDLLSDVEILTDNTIF